ncbi:hypothetical protein B0H13DRAFT_2099522 [Mycena leptocephala]|nr:hypothetical protein B0H13DRAFT_2099522 [Mycena leptocephala]
MLNDWPRHRERCRAPTAPPPAELEYISVSAILFLADEDQPRIITVKCRPPRHPTRNRCPIPQLQPYFDAPPDSIVLTQARAASSCALHFMYLLAYRPHEGVSNQPLHSPHHLGAAPKPWYGNVVAFKFNGSRRQGYTEAGSNDLPALSAYFLSHQ